MRLQLHQAISVGGTTCKFVSPIKNIDTDSVDEIIWGRINNAPHIIGLSPGDHGINIYICPSLQ